MNTLMMKLPLRKPIKTTRFARSFTVSCLILSLSVFQSGCSSSSDPEPEPEAKELKTGKDPLSTEIPEAELVKLSKKLYQVGMYTVARDSLASLKDRYPLGAYANFAEVKYADSFFFNRDYNEAAKAYDSIIKNYPGSPDLPYVKLQAARSHVASARDAGRDRQPWERGLTIYDEIVSGYPGSAYAEIAKAERAKVVEELSAYDREIIEFYRREGNQAAVDAREARFKERWGARLQPTSPETANSRGDSDKRLLKDLGIAAPVVVAESTLTTTKTAVLNQIDSGSKPLSPLKDGMIAVQSVQCHNEGAPFATIELTYLPKSLSERSDAITLAPTDGTVRIEDLGLSARQDSWDCFASKDLRVTEDGALEIKSERSLSVAVLNDPPRLLISPAP
jgi:outer membrane assembly lipoprotein YfiO